MANTLTLNRDVYTDIDTLFDTRLGLLKKMDERLFKMCLTTGNELYNQRLNNEFDYINYRVFEEHYNKRNNIVLHNSYLSNIIKLLYVEIDLLITKKVEGGLLPNTKLVINTYPYTVNDDIKKSLKNTLLNIIKIEGLDVSFIDIASTELTMSYVDTSYDIAIMYNGLEWLNYQMVLSLTPATDTKLYVPLKLNKPTIFKTVKDLEDSINNRDMALRSYINISTIPIEHFNIDDIIKEKIIE